MPSSVVARIEYLPDSRTLRIFYVSGAIYDYLKVPEDQYVAMKASGSKGKFLNEEIKEKYDFRKVKGATM
jgi:hypothetical protein